MLRVNFKKKLSNFVVDVDFNVQDKEYVVVLGKSGAGKSVMAKVIAGIEELDEGGIFLRGREITHLPPENRRICYLPQRISLFPHMTVKENLLFPIKVRGEKVVEEKVREIAEAFGIEGFFNRKTVCLSGGEAQRVALARALLSNPEVIILDEPLSSLDFSTKVEIVDYLMKLRGSKTVIHITHDPFEAKILPTRILYMEEGRILFSGTWREFLENFEGDISKKIKKFFSPLYQQQS